MELGTLEAEAHVTGAESAKVLHGLRDNIVVELEVDTPGLF
jgi:hypothetical protein